MAKDTIESFNYFSYTIQTGSSWYMDTSVRDFIELHLLRPILSDLMTCSKDLSNRSIYALLNTHNLDTILQLKNMPTVMNPARVASNDWKS